MEKNSEGARFGWALRKEVLLALAVAGRCIWPLSQISQQYRGRQARAL
jgi:hypothetical protein